MIHVPQPGIRRDTCQQATQLVFAIGELFFSAIRPLHRRKEIECKETRFAAPKE